MNFNNPKSHNNNAILSAQQLHLAANLSHKVFEVNPIIERLPLIIECITCYDNILILGVNSGRILVYQLDVTPQGGSSLDVSIDKTISPSRKPIQQLEAVRSLGILIALFDSQLHIFDLDTFALLYSLTKSKGCSLFAVSVSRDGKVLRLCVAAKKRLQFFYTNMQDSRSTSFMELLGDLELSDTPRTLEFTKDNLVVFSLKKDYYYYEVSASSASAVASKPLEVRFSTGSRLMDPLCQKLHNDFIALGVDENKTIVYDTKGRPYLEYPIIWTTSPSAVCSVGCYLVGILPGLNCLEVVTIEPNCVSSQLIELSPTTAPASVASSTSQLSSSSPSSFLSSAMAPVLSVAGTVGGTLSGGLAATGLIAPATNVNQVDRLKLLRANGNAVCYVANQQNVYCLTAIKINEQLEQVVKCSNYELGLHLIDSQLSFNQSNSTWCPPPQPGVPRRVNPKEKILALAPFFSLQPILNPIEEALHRKIKNLNALNIFCVKKRFSEALLLFQTMPTDPSHLIAFLPGLLPDNYRAKLKLDEFYPTLTAIENAEAIHSLIDYLQFKRNEVLKEGKSLNDPSGFTLLPLIENRPVLKTRTQLLQIIDTTLLKCYLKTNDSLVPFFLRRETSFLHLEESERLLLAHGKLTDLIILYEKKEEHERALHLLLGESTKGNSVLFGHKHIIKYLNKIGNKHLALIFKYAKSVIEADASSGMKIFMDNSIEMDTLLAARASEKQKPSARKNRSLSSLKTGDREATLSVLLKINPSIHRGGEQANSALLSSELLLLDEDEEMRRSLDHKAVCKFLAEDIEANEANSQLVRAYLQHCIFIWADTDADLNNLLIDKYKLVIDRKGLNSGDFKRILLYFLSETNNYEANYALSKLDLVNYGEERAIVLGKLGKHTEALSIYVNVLSDVAKAEAYCEHVYKQMASEEAKQVFYQLLQIYLASEFEEVRIGASISLLNAHSEEIGNCLTIERLPAELMKCQNLSPFFESMLTRLVRNRHATQVLNRLMFALELQIHETKIMCQDQKFTVNDEQMCSECNKRMGRTAMVRFPNGRLIHYGCMKSSETSTFGSKIANR